MNEKLKAIGLIRLSTQEQAQEGRAGIDRQRNDIAIAARVHCLDVVRVVEVIESGTKVRGQADFQQIFRELKSGSVDGVVCSNLDRLVRPDCFEDFAVFDHFRANKKLIWTPAEMVDPSTQGGFLMSGFRGLLAGLERQLIVSRTTAGKEVQRERGWHPNGDQILPRGVGCERIKEGKRTVGVRWFYAEPDASRVRCAFELLLAGNSYRSIAATVGGGWTANGIRNTMLKYALVRRADLSADSRPQDSARTPRHPRVRGPDQPRDLGASARDYHGAKKNLGRAEAEAALPNDGAV
jgi:DNA invertase Pin-like site-specific DNA recombinase